MLASLKHALLKCLPKRAKMLKCGGSFWKVRRQRPKSTCWFHSWKRGGGRRSNHAADASERRRHFWNGADIGWTTPTSNFRSFIHHLRVNITAKRTTKITWWSAKVQKFRLRLADFFSNNMYIFLSNKNSWNLPPHWYFFKSFKNKSNFCNAHIFVFDDSATWLRRRLKKDPDF